MSQPREAWWTSICINIYIYIDMYIHMYVNIHAYVDILYIHTYDYDISVFG